MSVVGFKKVIPAGGFDSAAVNALSSNIKTYIVNAGFSVLTNTSSAIDFMQSGHGAAEYNDDIPRWYIETPSGSITPYAYFGTGSSSGTLSTNLGSLSSDTTHTEVTIHFAADGAHGWWWLHVAEKDTSQTSGYVHVFGVIGTVSRRYPADNHQGLCNRYGIIDMIYGTWYIPRSLNHAGAPFSGPSLNCWSPISIGDTSYRRHSGSPLQKMSVPIYPSINPQDALTASIHGEFADVMALTDGYALGEVVAPGWVAMVGEDDILSLAVRAPNTFTVL